MNKQLMVKTGLDEIKGIVLKGISNPNTRSAYETGLDRFLNWYQSENKTGLNKSIVQEYKTTLDDSGLSPATINLRMCAVRAWVVEAMDNSLLDPVIGAGILRIKGVKSEGVRTGNWLDKKQAQAVLDNKDITTPKGLRDRAIIAVAVGSGLRRSEIASLKVEDIQQRESRWVILDIIGKGGRVRTVPIKSWVKEAVDQWLIEADISEGLIFRAVRKGGQVIGESMSSQAVQDVIVKYGKISAHDLRRTFAKLAHVGGCPVDQIQISLGHKSLLTTERYLGVRQDLTSAPCDFLGLKI